MISSNSKIFEKMALKTKWFEAPFFL